MTKPPTSDAAGAVLPDWLISLIGDYGFASRSESDVQALHRWELLIAGIKRYASTPQPPPEAGSVGVPEDGEAPLSRSWRALVNALADDLEAEIENRRAGDLSRRIERDLEVVRTARKRLAAAPAPKETP